MIARNEINAEDPTSLFRFRSFDHYAVSGLVQGTTWFADPRSFNDPFDTLFVFDEGFTNEAVAAHLNSCASSRGEPERYTADNVDDEMSDMSKFLGEMRRTLRSCGVLSLSATPYEVLLWSHYADQHRGFCIEYERNSSNELGKNGCRAVSYRDDLRPIVDRLDFFRSPEKFLHDILYSKAACWRYEMEWRLVYLNPGPNDLVRERLVDARIKPIIFGLRCSESDMSTVASILKTGPDVSFYVMKATAQGLDLVPHPIERDSAIGSGAGQQTDAADRPSASS